MRAYLVLLIAGALATDCGNFQSEAALLKSGQNEYITEDCILEWIELDWWDGADYKIAQALAADVEFTDMIKRKGTMEVFKIDTLLNLIEQGQADQKMDLAFRWAQSKDKIFLEVKFSHRFDTPGCIEVLDDKEEITERGLLITGSCPISSIKFDAKLDITFYDEIIPEESSFEKSSVGRMFVTLKKKESPRAWPRLLKSKTNKPKNMIFWWDQQEKFNKELKELEQED